LKDNVCNFEADLWALGCIIYELYVGSPPFMDADEYTVFKKIQYDEITFPSTAQIPEHAKKLIVGLLNKDKNNRLGCGYADSPNSFKSGLKQHPYFSGIEF
jgi:3-phosphoinositide dependent protein kinase-1